MRKVPFVVLTITRSGSTWFLSLLNGQPGVAAYEELFLDRPIGDKYAWVAAGSPPRFAARRADLGATRFGRIGRYLQEIDDFTVDRQAYGFKLMLGQLHDNPELLPAMARRRYRLLCLVRENVFASAVSRLVVEQGGDAHGTGPGAVDQPLRLDPAALVREIEKRQLGIRMLKVAARLWPWPSKVVQYQDLVDRRTDTMQAILKTLGSTASVQPVESPLQRRVAVPYTALIENLSEVLDHVDRIGLGRVVPAELRLPNGQSASTLASTLPSGPR